MIKKAKTARLRSETEYAGIMYAQWPFMKDLISCFMFTGDLPQCGLGCKSIFLFCSEKGDFLGFSGASNIMGAIALVQMASFTDPCKLIDLEIWEWRANDC